MLFRELFPSHTRTREHREPQTTPKHDCDDGSVFVKNVSDRQPWKKWTANSRALWTTVHAGRSVRECRVSIPGWKLRTNTATSVVIVHLAVRLIRAVRNDRVFRVSRVSSRVKAIKSANEIPTKRFTRTEKTFADETNGDVARWSYTRVVRLEPKRRRTVRYVTRTRYGSGSDYSATNNAARTRETQ